MEIIIGDIHGCYDELQRLLNLISPSPSDTIYSIGDLVDRGPKSVEVFELFSQNSQFRAIKGNHERKHVKSEKGECQPSLSQLITKEEFGERYAEFLKFAEALPKYIELDSALLVHGGFQVGVELNNQLENVLTGSMSGERLMKKTHNSKDWWDVVSFPKPIIFGHKGFDEPFIFTNDKGSTVYGIDTKCVKGGKLTALLLPSFEIVLVPSIKNYWAINCEYGKIKFHKPKVDIKRTIDRINIIAYEIKSKSDLRRDYFSTITSRQLPKILSKAYDKIITEEDLKDYKKAGSLVVYVPNEAHLERFVYELAQLWIEEVFPIAYSQGNDSIEEGYARYHGSLNAKINTKLDQLLLNYEESQNSENLSTLFELKKQISSNTIDSFVEDSSSSDPSEILFDRVNAIAKIFDRKGLAYEEKIKHHIKINV